MTTDKTSIIKTPTITNAAFHVSHSSAEFFVSMGPHTNGSPNPYYGSVNYNGYDTTNWPVAESVTPTLVRIGSTGVTQIQVRPPALSSTDVPSPIVLRFNPYVTAVYKNSSYTTQIYPTAYYSSEQHADLVLYNPASNTGFRGGVVELPVNNAVVIPYDTSQFVSAVLHITGRIMALDSDFGTPTYVANSNYFYNSHFGWTFNDLSLALEF